MMVAGVLLASSHSYCQESEMQNTNRTFCQGPIEAFLELDLGYRRDKTTFHDTYDSQLAYAGPPPVQLISAYDDLAWTGLNIFEIGGQLNFSYKNFLLTAQGDWGTVINGDNSDVDGQTLFNQFPGETTGVGGNHIATNTTGSVYDISTGIGYQFYFCCRHFIFTPLIGYCVNKQKYQEPHFTNSISIRPPDPALAVSFDLVGSRTSKFSWQGVWGGFDLAYETDAGWNFFSSYNLHWGHAAWFGTAHLLLTQTFPAPLPTFPFRAARKLSKNGAWGQDARIGLSYRFQRYRWSHWKIGLTGGYKYWTIHKGQVTKDEIGGPIHVKAKSAPPKLTWQSGSLELNIAYMF